MSKLSTKTKASTTTEQDESSKQQEQPCFYKLNAAELPDDLFRKEADVKDWIGNYDNNCNNNKGLQQQQKQQLTRTLPPWMATTSDPKGFAAGKLHRVAPIDRMVDIERCIGVSLYMIGNVNPFVVPLLAGAWLLLKIEVAKYALLFVLMYTAGLYTIWRLVFVPIFLRRYNRGPKLEDDLNLKDPAYSQYLFTERNITKYCSISYVWPAGMQRPALEQTSVIYCVIPHGLAPYGIVGYPFWSKVWNSKLCSWTCAPVLLKLPMIGYYLKAIGYIPAKSRNIQDALTKKDRNVGIILDGIDGMFHSSSSGNEVGAILNRKGIVKIAIKANVPIVPVYGFGHTSVYDVLVDPFGILQFLSKTLSMSITPFFGRWMWFMGPPKRTVPITVCLGDPIYPPKTQSKNNGDDDDIISITQEQIDDYHTKLLDGFTKVFETHKKGYYGGQNNDDAVVDKKKLIFVK